MRAVFALIAGLGTIAALIWLPLLLAAVLAGMGLDATAIEPLTWSSLAFFVLYGWMILPVSAALWILFARYLNRSILWLFVSLLCGLGFAIIAGGLNVGRNTDWSDIETNAVLFIIVVLLCSGTTGWMVAYTGRR